MRLKKFRYVCKKCGSGNVRIQGSSDYLGDHYIIVTCDNCGESETS